MMNALASDTGLEVLALTAIILSLIGIVVGALGVGRSLRRLKRYTTPGSRRSYARKTAYFAFSRFAQVALFLATGIILSVMPDGDLRSAIARMLVITVLTILVSIMLIDEPWDAHIDSLREKESRRSSRKDTDK